MRVVFLQDVAGVAQGGDVKEVKNGFARNYLIPKNFAVPATHNELQRVRQYSEQAERTRLRLLQDMRELSETLNGTRIDVEMRAGASGQLYGSVTNAIIADRLSEMSDREIDRRGIEIVEPIRQLGSFGVNVRLHPEVQTQVEVLVYPTGTTADDWLASLEEAEEPAEGESESEIESAEATDASEEPTNESGESEEDNPSDAS